jgi:putative molybdopterin biosynthesis protein
MKSPLLTAEEVARQLRIKKYTVYELIKRGELPSSRVGKRVRISQEDIDRYLRAGRTGPLAEETIPAARREEAGEDESGTPHEPAEAPIILSGQDLCLDLLMNRLSVLGLGPVLRSYSGCYNSLIALYKGTVSMAASHLWDGETESYNYPFIRRLLPGLPAGVLRLAGRRQGFYVKKGNPLKIRGWEDLARPELTMINREQGCGTRILLDQKLKTLGIRAEKIHGYGRESTSHMACASIVAKGGADLGCGCERGAENISGTDFIPLQLEWYDLVFRLRDRDSPAVQALAAYISGVEFRQDLVLLGGYDLSQTGTYVEL